MSTTLWISLLLLQFSTVNTDLEGGWVNMTKDGNTHQILFSGPYFTYTVFKTESGAFLMTKGGIWQKSDLDLWFIYEFHTKDSSMVGLSERQSIMISEEGFELTGDHVPMGKWKSLDQGESTDLSHTWLFSGRKRDGNMTRRDTSRPRKTMKVLTGNRFQWIAFNTETKQFFGTGGGNYTAKDGIYTENIEFFSRDDTRVGASLKFNYKMMEGDWHHTGKSSKGAPMYELWSKRK